MPKPPSILRPAALVLSTSALKVHIPLAMVVWLGVICASRAVAPTLEAGPVPLPAHQDQRWTASSGLPVAVASLAVRGALPPPDPRQKPAPCDDELGEEDIGGACWQRLPVAKCNERKAFPHNGRCYLRVMQVAPLPREPTSGEGRPLGVADP